MAVGYRWILYEYNTWLVSANAEECVIAEKHLTDTIFWQIGSLDPTRPNPTTGQPDPRPALGRAHTHTHTRTHTDATKRIISPATRSIATHEIG